MNVGLIFPLLIISTAKLLTVLPNAPVMTARQIAGAFEPPSPGRRPPAAATDGALEPNASGVIDLAGLMTAEQRLTDQAQPANPFRLRYHPALAARNVTVTVGAIIRGADRIRDCCVLNDQAVRAGESFEGLTVHEIEGDRVILQTGPYRLALPAGDRPLTLRLPQ